MDPMFNAPIEESSNFTPLRTSRSTEQPNGKVGDTSQTGL